MPRKQQGIVSKIAARQLVSDKKRLRLFGVEPSSRPFQKLPARLCFQLCSLVDATTLKKGHIFLGFLKDGNFVISYTHVMGPEEESGKTSHVYYLHWWLFVPNRKLQKIGKVRLFGADEVAIESCLSIAVCQWPRDHTKVLVYGTDVSGHTRNTYITIATCPLLSCHSIQSSEGFDVPCKRCCTAVHYVNQHIPVYPQFIPFVTMKVDGLCVVNGGDSLIAFALESAHSCRSTPLDAPLVLAGSAASNASQPPLLPDSVRYVQAEYGHDDDGEASERRATYVGGGLLGAVSPLVFAASSNGKPLRPRRGGGVICKLLMLNVESYFLSELGDFDDCSFVDFDMIILDVCEVSYSVIAQINIVYRRKSLGTRILAKGETHVHTRVTDLVKRSIRFAWSLVSGEVTRLSESDFSEARNNVKSWSCQPDEPLLLRNRFGIPSSALHSVTCMSNMPVLKGESLKMLVDANNYIAIVL